MGKVEDTFEEILDDDSEEQFWESNYYWGAARFQIEQENFGRALKLINKALKINKYDTDFVSTKAEILFEKEDFKDALKWIKKCEKMEEEIGEKEAGTFMLMANIYHDTRKFALSTKALLKAIRLFKKNKSKTNRGYDIQDAHYQIGHNYFHLKKFNLALRWLKKAQLQKPRDDSGRIQYDRSQIFVEQKKYHQAGKEIQKALSDSDDSDYYLMAAYIAVLTKRKPWIVWTLFARAGKLFPGKEAKEDEKNWGKEIKVIKRYLKNVDDEQFGKELVWLKNEIINAKSARRATK